MADDSRRVHLVSNKLNWSIFEYDDPLRALDSFLAFKRSSAASDGKRQHWSLGGWARRLDLASTSVITNILKGRNVPSLGLIQKIAESMELDTEATEYLILLFERQRQKEALPLLREALDRRIEELRIQHLEL
jgi:hypothetical protein